MVEKQGNVGADTFLHFAIDDFGETLGKAIAAAIAKAKDYGAVAVEMEAAALYAFSAVKEKPVICYAHLTNTMAREGDDFEKGAENGSLASLNLVAETVKVALL